MKQIILLEPHEVAQLKKGKTLMINTAAGEVGLQFIKEEEEFKCDVCGVAEGIHGPFTSLKGVRTHKRFAHKNIKSMKEDRRAKA